MTAQRFDTNKTLHIVPVGTSILQNAGWNSGSSLPKKQALLQLLETEPRKNSAELNALLPLIKNEQHTSVHLLATDTDQSKRCRDAIQAFLQKQNVHLTGAEADQLLPAAIDQPSDQAEFYEGIRRFRELVFRVADRGRQRDEEVLINITGGLKATAAVAALVAAELGLSAYYLHQSMTEPMFLPTASLDHVLMGTLRKLKDVLNDREERLRLLAHYGKRLQREGLVRISKDVNGDPSNVTITSYGHHLLDPHFTESRK